ncbi:MAG: hypothetical protein Q9169_005159 [Polycauliona sp. 2 TL-2023]
MTLVWRTRSGSLMQTEVGTVDLVNTYSAARTVYGWMGGTDGLRFLLERIPNFLGQRLTDLKLDRSLRLMPFQGYVLTSHGPLVAQMNDPQESFGGDIRTQIIGTSLCALAHECELLTAARLFGRFLMPYLFGGPGPVVDALQSQLMENSTLQRIVNEGASRGLNRCFVETAAQLNLPLATQGWRRTKLGEQDRGYEFLGEVNMIGGFLKWIAQDGNSEYRTRSSCVARIAAYFKAIGYSIGGIETWDGEGTSPHPMGIKSLVLVLGGSSETDKYMEEHQQIPDTQMVLHYQYSTVGAMLLTALGNAPKIRPEVLQVDFEKIFEYVEDHLMIEYILEEGQLHATFHWTRDKKEPTALAVRLAAFYFADSAELVAPCFARIANEKHLDSIKEGSKRKMKPKRQELGRFRAITAAVAISIISRFAPETFKTAHHATALDLSLPDWLSSVCTILDQEKSLPISMVVTLLASVHAAHDLDGIDALARTNNIIAWRNGIYSVVPSLLLDMEISKSCFHFVCLDVFWANVKVREDGSIRSSFTPSVVSYPVDNDEYSGNSTNRTSLERLNDPHLGPANVSAPDCPLYLSLGTPVHTGEPDLCFVAWINGSVAGTVGIYDVLKALHLSLVEPEACPGHEKPVEVVNIKTSVWAQDMYSRPTSKYHPLFVPASGDKCWAIFAAGQRLNEGCRVVFRCPACAIENYVSTLPGRSSQEEEHGCFIGFL